MVIKKYPRGGGPMDSGDWTRWFFPSKMAGLIYRRFAPTPHAIDFPRQQRIIRRLSMAYFVTTWSLVCVIGGYAYYRTYHEGLLNPSVEVSSLNSMLNCR